MMKSFTRVFSDAAIPRNIFPKRKQVPIIIVLIKQDMLASRLMFLLMLYLIN